MEVSYVIPEENHSGVKVLEVALNPEERNAKVHFDSGDSAKLTNANFLTIWSGMTADEKTAVKNFVDAVVDNSTVNGQNVVVTDGF